MAVLDHIISGKFTSTGASKILNLQCGVDWIQTVNVTQMTTTANPGVGVKFEWFSTMSNDTGIEFFKTNSTNALNGEIVDSGGFTPIDSSVALLGPALTATAITAANPAVVSMASTAGLAVGDVVRVTNSTGMLQIAGQDFTITALTANTSITLGYLDASGFAAPATAAIIRKVYYDPIYYPARRFITKISKATSAVVTLSVTHGYTVGQRIVFNIPAAFGMVELNGLRGEITAVDLTNNTITVNIDTSAFTTFAYPTSAVAAVGVTFAQAIPFGDGPPIPNPLGNQSVLDGATRNIAIRGILLAGGANSPAGQANDVIHWIALKSEQVFSE